MRIKQYVIAAAIALTVFFGGMATAPEKVFAAGSNSFVSIAYNSTNNNYLVAYAFDARTGGTADWRVNANLYTYAGVLLNSVNLDTTGNADQTFYPAVAYDPADNVFLVAWGHQIAGVKVAVISAANGAVTKPAVLVTAGTVKNLSASYDAATSQFFISWFDTVSTKLWETVFSYANVMAGTAGTPYDVATKMLGGGWVNLVNTLDVAMTIAGGPGGRQMRLVNDNANLQDMVTPTNPVSNISGGITKSFAGVAGGALPATALANSGLIGMHAYLAAAGSFGYNFVSSLGTVPASSASGTVAISTAPAMLTILGPDITYNAKTGTFMAIWPEKDSPGTIINLRKTEFSSAGAIIAGSTQFLTSGAVMHDNPAIAANDNCGNFMVAYNVQLNGDPSGSMGRISLAPIGPVCTGTINVTPATATFAPIPAGSSATIQLVISNVGLGALNVSPIAPLDAVNFGVTPSVTNGCPTTAGFTLTPNTSCNIDVMFTPTVTGALSSTLPINSNDPVTPVKTIPLSGTGSTISVPTNVTATPDYDVIHLNWTAPAGSTGSETYNVYEVLQGGVTQKLNGTPITGTAYDDVLDLATFLDAGYPFVYSVRVVVNGTEGPDSLPAAAYGLGPTQVDMIWEPGTLVTDYSLVSPGFVMTQPTIDAMLATMAATPYDPRVTRIFSILNGLNYSEYPNVPAPMPGQGYFTISRDGGSAILDGTATVPTNIAANPANAGPAGTNYYDIQLNSGGYSLRGNPYMFPIDISTIKVTDGNITESIGSATLVDQAVWVYGPGGWTMLDPATEYLADSEGFAIKNRSGKTVTMKMYDGPSITGMKKMGWLGRKRAAGSSVTSSVSRKNIPVRGVYGTLPDPTEMRLNLALSARGYTDKYNAMGYSFVSSDGYDRRDISDPPRVGGMPTLYFPHNNIPIIGTETVLASANLAYDYRGQTFDKTEWTAIADGAGAEAAVLRVTYPAQAEKTLYIVRVTMPDGAVAVPNADGDITIPLPGGKPAEIKISVEYNSAADTDHDFLLDTWEIKYYGSIGAVDSWMIDDDSDGMTLWAEMNYNANPLVADMPNVTGTVPALDYAGLAILISVFTASLVLRRRRPGHTAH